MPDIPGSAPIDPSTTIYGLTVAVAEEIATLGLGTFTRTPSSGDGQNIFVDEEPPQPVRAITIFEIPGGTMGENTLEEEHLIQIRTRDPDYQAAANLIHNIQLGLHNRDGLIGGVLVGYIRATAPGAVLGREESRTGGGAWRFVQTYRVLTKVNFAFV